MSDHKTHPVTTLIGGLLIGALLGAIGVWRYYEHFTKTEVLPAVEETRHNLDELAKAANVAAQKAATLKASTQSAKQLFEDYADQFEKMGAGVVPDKKKCAASFRGHARSFQEDLDRADAIK